MKILFIDESERHTKFFVMSSFISNLKDSVFLEQDIEKFKNQNNIISLKDLRGNLPRNKKIHLTQDLCQLLSNREIKFMSVILGKTSMKKINFEDRYFDAITFLIERFLLEIKDQYGIIIADLLPRDQILKIKKNVNDFLQKEGVYFYGKLKGLYRDRIYPTVLFLDTKSSNMLGISDLIATAIQNSVFNFIEKGEELANLKYKEDKLFNEIYNEYLPMYKKFFALNPITGKIGGWGIKYWD